MKRTSARLADGREIIYFDLDDDAVRRLDDPRELPPVSTASQIRHDPLLDEWVAMASHRQTRTFLPPADLCPLCPSRDGKQTEVPSADYDVVVFENRFPSLSMGAVDPGGAAHVPGTPVGVSRAGLGRCEVVCFSSEHQASFRTLAPERARLVVDAWADRTAELSALPGVAQVFCFENRGEEIGVTLSHPHGQIYAYPYVTPRTAQMLRTARRYRDEHDGANLFADVLAAERSAERVVVASTHWTAFVPAAARWPVEVQLFPHRQVPDIASLTDDERDDFVTVYLDVLRRFDALYDAPLPYIAAWQQAPVHADRDVAYLHLQLFSIKRAADKLKYLAGSESAMGAFITDVLPEDVAERLRSVA
ncbi:galactose-1-phosphate uridylyltransferase [Phytoactinopolyspora halotolerans]|uniref:Galactose-1-phosphate uridylyltransferase n=1 Tax=Phytoactinopolyspora halotolerans TaxID=1981512 RepID=A0A6L9S404_9ACTN|nr:galactose-1-phosphate uridylyltransferase [Phytoactinopolyspora halotolerans]NED99570.1 galactose-1-phosphate uridylyltransferase [Phytoactinopolyspora halotolerans]